MWCLDSEGRWACRTGGVLSRSLLVFLHGKLRNVRGGRCPSLCRRADATRASAGGGKSTKHLFLLNNRWCRHLGVRLKSFALLWASWSQGDCRSRLVRVRRINCWRLQTFSRSLWPQQNNKKVAAVTQVWVRCLRRLLEPVLSPKTGHWVDLTDFGACVVASGVLGALLHSLSLSVSANTPK